MRRVLPKNQRFGGARVDGFFGEAEMVVKELDPEVVARVRHTYRETECLEASPARGLG